MLRSEQMLQRKSCRRGADLDATGRSCLSPNRARAGGVHEIVAFAARQFDLPGKERESRDPYLVISTKSHFDIARGEASKMFVQMRSDAREEFSLSLICFCGKPPPRDRSADRSADHT